MKLNLGQRIYKLFFVFVFFIGFQYSFGQTTISSWTFEPLQGTDTNPTPNIGSGTTSIINGGGGTIGTVGAYQRMGMTGSGCGVQIGSAFGAWALEPFAPGSSNESNGAQFNVSTVGNQNITLTWDQRFSDTSPNTVRLKYTINGSTWNNFIMTGSNTTLCGGSINGNGCFENDSGDVYRRIAVDFTSIPAANNNANFAVRILASYYQSTTEFRQSAAPTSPAGAAGTWRFDNITFSGVVLTPPSSSIISNSGSANICGSGSATIKVNILGGVSPYTLVYTDGTSNFTVSNYISGTNISVSPASSTTYTIVSVTAANAAVGTGNSGSATVTVSAIPTVTFTTSAGTNSCISSDVVYTTQTGQNNYLWTVSGVLGTDYTISSGDIGTSSNTVTIKWLTTGNRSVSINYSNASGCSGTVTSSSTTVNTIPTITASAATTAVCSATSSQTTPLAYSATTNSPNKYSIVWNATPTNSFAPVTNAALPPSSITIIIPANTPGGTYTGSLTVTILATGCSSVASTFTVQVNAKVAITSQPVTTAQSVCLGSSFNAITVGCSGTGAINYQWYRNPNNVIVSGAGWQILSPVGTFPNEVANGSKTATFTPLSNAVGTFYYYVKVTNTSAPCTPTTVNSSVCGPFTVYQATGGTLTGDATVCSGTNSTTLTLGGYTSSILKWQSSPVSNFSSGVVDIVITSPTLTATNLTSTTYYRAVVTDGPAALCSTTSSTATITVIPSLVAGTVSGGTTICSASANTTLTLSGNTGSVLNWQSSSASDFSVSPTTISNTATTLNVTGVISTTYYRAVIQSGSCSAAYSSGAQIFVNSTTWNGGWSNGSPSSEKQVVFNSNYTSLASETGDLTACSLIISPNINVVVSSGATFTVENEVSIATAPASLTFQDTSSLIQVNTTGVTNSGTIVYKRSVLGLHGYDYIYWSSPVASQNISGLYSTPSMGNSYYWDTLVNNLNGASSITSQGNWISASVANPMEIGKGYIVRASSSYGWAGGLTSSFTGIPNNGDISVPIYRGSYWGANYFGANGSIITSLDDNWNLIGNPYPSAIKVTDFLSANINIDGYINLWTHGVAPAAGNNPFYGSFGYNYTASDYITYNATGTLSGPTGFNGFIAAGQSFFVCMNDGAATSSEVVSFKNNMRSSDNSQFNRTASTATMEEEKNRIWLDLVDTTNEAVRTLVGYLPEATLGIDRLYDANKNIANETNIYTVVDNQTLIIQGRPTPFDQNDQVALGINIKQAGTYKIAIGAVDGLFTNQDIYLEDTLTNDYFNLKNGIYTFASEIGTFNSRFILHYIPASLGTFQPNASAVIVYQNSNQIHINAGSIVLKEVAVYDLQGRILATFKNCLSSNFSFNSPANDEVFILKITTAENSVFYKKVVN